MIQMDIDGSRSFFMFEETSIGSFWWFFGGLNRTENSVGEAVEHRSAEVELILLAAGWNVGTFGFLRVLRIVRIMRALTKKSRLIQAEKVGLNIVGHILDFRWFSGAMLQCSTSSWIAVHILRFAESLPEDPVFERVPWQCWQKPSISMVCNQRKRGCECLSMVQYCFILFVICWRRIALYKLQ